MNKTQPASPAYLTPAMVKWGIDRSGLSYERIRQLVKGVSEDQIRAWENGEEYPEFDKAIRLAKVLHVPFGMLFLPTPPDLSKLPLPDLRAPEEAPPEPSSEFIDLLNDVLLKQAWYRDYAIDNNYEEISFVGSQSVNGVGAVASSITETLSLDNHLRRRVYSWSEYLTELAHVVESIGILVMRSGVVGNDTSRKLSPNEFQGFAIADPIAPVIFINSQDFKTAQIFTLAHELAHIWIGKTGVSKADEIAIDPEPKSKDAEIFCNQVAAEVLAPEDEFKRVWRRQDGDLTSVAKHFWVSTIVVLRRAHELREITRARFFELLEIERGKNRPTQAPGGGDYYRNVIARHGNTLTEAVIRDVKQGGTLYRDAARILSVKVPTLMRLVERS